MSEHMRNEYIDIPAQPEELQKLLWARQEMSVRLKEASEALTDAHMNYLKLIGDNIALNRQITTMQDSM